MSQADYERIGKFIYGAKYSNDDEFQENCVRFFEKLKSRSI